jgi:hypothetical protein
MTLTNALARRHVGERSRTLIAVLVAVVVTGVAPAPASAEEQTSGRQRPQDPRAAMLERARNARAAIEAAQQQLRGRDRVVSLPLTCSGVRQAVANPAFPMALTEGDTLRASAEENCAFVIEWGDGPAPTALQQPAGSLRVDADNRVAWLAYGQLKHAVGASELVWFRVADPVTKALPERRLAHFRLATVSRADPATPPERDRLVAAQEALRTNGLQLTELGLPDAITIPEIPLELSDTQPLRIINPTPTPMRLDFVDDQQHRLLPPVMLEPGQVYELSIEDARKYAGADYLLPFDIVVAGSRSDEDRLVQTGYLSVSRPDTLKGKITIQLDVTGVADWRFLNPRSPRRLDPTNPPTLEFVTRVPGRTIILTFPAIKRAFEHRFREAGFVVKCTRPATCTPSLQVQGTQRTVGGRLILDAYADEVMIQFRVSFFEADVEPANPIGYLRVHANDYEPGFTAAWNLTAFAGFQRDAYFAGFPLDAAKAATIDAEHSFKDQHRWHLAGNVRLIGLAQLGTRATGEVELMVKDKDFGVADSPTVTTQKARINVFGLNDVVLSFGRFDFATPTRGLAIAESGEGVSARWRMVSFSYIVKPHDPYDIAPELPKSESTPATMAASPAATERWSTLTQFQLPAWGARLEGSTLVGRRKTYRGGEGLYFTGGADVIAAGGIGQHPDQPASTEAKAALAADRGNVAAKWAWRLSGGGYVSRRQARASDIDDEDGDSGWSALVDGALSTLGKDGAPRFTFGGTLARGSADDTATAEDEGYVGESTAFAPDKIFLGVLAAKFAALQLSTPDASGQPRYVRRSISGKTISGAGVTWHKFSPLEGITKLLNVPSTDIDLKSTTLRWLGYSLRKTVTGGEAGSPARSWLGQELLAEFLLESPKAVRYALTAGVFVPGELLKVQKLVTRATWTFDARVTVTFR